jgi:phage/plasmid-like protein (TIGR03299 family)
MSHEVESMFYVSNEENGRFVPWHGLGTPVKEAQTSKEAIKVAGLDWTVESKPIYSDKGIEIPGFKANTRNIDDKVLGIVSNRYRIVQNSDAFDFTDSLIGEEVKYETAGSLCGGKRIFLLAKLPDKKILDDDFDNYICFTNSHDGKGAIEACMTPTRVVCQNTLNLALSKATRKWSTRHTGNIESKLAEAKHTLQLAEEYMNELAIVADQMANTTVTESEVVSMLDEIYPMSEDISDRAKRTINQKKNDFMVCMLSPDILKFKNTAWGVINAASDFSTHKAPARLTSNYQENKFNKLLDGDKIIDKVFAKLMTEKVLKKA